MACNCLKKLDSGFRRNDGKRCFWTFYESIIVDAPVKRSGVKSRGLGPPIQGEIKHSKLR